MVILQDGNMLGGQFDCLGNKQSLRFKRARGNPPLQLIINDALVQGVLVDDEHAFVSLGNEIGSV